MSSHAPDHARVIPLRPAAPAVAPGPAPAPGPAVDEGAPPAPVVREPLWRHVVGDVLRRERLAQERTLKDVSEAARISMPYLSEIERGRKEASSEVLAAAAHALGLDLAGLLTLAQDELARIAEARLGAAVPAFVGGRITSGRGIPAGHPHRALPGGRPAGPVMLGEMSLAA
jgi:transcriptional regulator with XRE-family HTH domain